jgi:glutaminyl-tRNA synthetase
MCTLEFADHQPLYRWYIAQLGIFPSEQTEFDRLNITYTVLSKRRLIQFVRENVVNGWDDPRMPTLSGYRRRGFTPEAIRAFVAAASSATTSTAAPTAPWPSCARSSWSSTTIQKVRKSMWK